MNEQNDPDIESGSVRRRKIFPGREEELDPSVSKEENGSILDVERWHTADRRRETGDPV